MTHHANPIVVVWASVETLTQVEKMLEQRAAVMAASGPAAGLSRLVNLTGVTTLIAEKTMGPAAVVLLEAARRKFPTVRRILLTCDEDLSSLIGLLHAGTVDVLLPLPLDGHELAMSILPASEPAVSAEPGQPVAA